MIKFLIFLFQLFMLIFLAIYIITNSFIVTFDINELQFIFSSNLLLFSIVLLVFFIFILQLFYFKSRYNLQKYFMLKNNKKLKKGYGYFVEAMIALANKDKKNAIIANNKMKKFIKDDQGLSFLLNSEIFKIEKKYHELSLLHEEMIKNKKTQTLGYKGLMEENLKKQDYHHAFIYAEKLFQLNPFIDGLYITLVSIIAKTRNWNQLIYISKESYNKKIINLKLFNQNSAIAYYEISKIKTQSDPKESLNLVLKAIKLHGPFPPFIKLHLEILLLRNEISKLTKTIKKYWSDNPNSSLRSMISEFLKENKIVNLENIKFIIKGNHNDKESKKLLLDFAIHNCEWSIARENITGLIQIKPDREICEFMSFLELGEFNDKQKSDAWMLRAENANLNEVWICQITNISQNKWSSVADSGHFNSLEWRRPKMLGTTILNDE